MKSLSLSRISRELQRLVSPSHYARLFKVRSDNKKSDYINEDAPAELMKSEHCEACLKAAQDEVKRLGQELTEARREASVFSRETIIRGWVDRQFLYWKQNKRSMDQALRAFQEFNDQFDYFYIFRISRGFVSVVEKKASSINAFHHDRAMEYQKFIQLIVDKYPDIPDMEMGVCVGDGSFPNQTYPTFAFQYRSLEDSKVLLLPDIDLITERFCEDGRYTDSIPYASKACRAVFAGSTSNGWNTLESVRAMSNPRVHAAHFFRDKPDVDFRLLGLVQCIGENTEETLRGVGIGIGSRMSMEDQFSYRFMLSMDGNGPTCLRVFLGLRSNCILLKYDTPCALYYFYSILPWVHYIPIQSHEDVLTLIDIERSQPGYFKRIAEAGQAFAGEYLTMDSGIKYTAALLREYATLFGAGLNVDVTLDAEKEHPIVIGGMAVGDANQEYFSNRTGFIGAGPGSRQFYGFTLFPEPELNWYDLEYQSITSSSDGKWVKGGEFSGSRGDGALIGLRVRLSSAASNGSSLRLKLIAHGSDGLEYASQEASTVEVIGSSPLHSFKLLLLGWSGKKPPSP